MREIVSLLPACRGTRCLSVRPFNLSVRLSVTLQFSNFFSAVFLDIDLKFATVFDHEFVMTYYRSSLSFVTLYQLLQDLHVLPVARI